MMQRIRTVCLTMLILVLCASAGLAAAAWLSVFSAAVDQVLQAT